MNPPQKPTTKNALIFGETIPALFNSPKINPTKKHPKIFTVKVAKGKVVLKYVRYNLFVKYLQQVPKNPPIPANNINLNIDCLSSNSLGVAF